MNANEINNVLWNGGVLCDILERRILRKRTRVTRWTLHKTDCVVKKMIGL